MRKWLFIPLFSLLFSCGENESIVDNKQVNLNEFSDRIGYVLGSLNAKSILQSGNNMNELNKELLVDGFSNNLSDRDCSDCNNVMLELFGPYGQDFDTTKIDSGSNCMGRITAFRFHADMLRMGGDEKINMEMVKVGFRDGIYSLDTLIDEAEKRTIVQNFITDLNSLNGDKMMNRAKEESGAKVFDNGVVMFTLEEGRGNYPNPKDDVEVEYILTNAYGDTLQSSYEMKRLRPDSEPVYLSLNGGVIAGWSFAIPKMRVGGKSRVYIPWDLAYGEQGNGNIMPRESLCFFIELKGKGPEGSLFKLPLPKKK